MAKNKKITTIEDLAIMIQKGFEESAEKMDAGFEAVNKEISNLKSEIMTLRHDFDELKLKISKLEIIPAEFSFKIQDFEKRMKKVETELQLK